jgi:hypothetical protein
MGKKKENENLEAMCIKSGNHEHRHTDIQVCYNFPVRGWNW